MLRSSPVRVLDDRDIDAVRAVLSREPVTNVFVASRVEGCGLSPARLGAEIWGYSRGGRLDAVCYAGANLVPASADEVAARSFAERARRAGRHCSSIVGAIDAVDVMWEHLSSAWGPAREIRRPQPHLSIDGPAKVDADPAVRRVRPDEIDVLMPACIAMFTEEVGVSPTAGDGGALYRARVAELIADGRSFARIENGMVVFKAEIGAATRDACQVQGVWVDPRLRGQGIGTSGTAAVVELARATVAPTVSLYVNDFNTAARSAYARVGFREIGAFCSILF